MSKELKTNYKDAAKRYELAERTIWAKLADWQKKLITEAKTTPTETLNDFKLLRARNRSLEQYTHEIISLAESETKLDEKLPPVPEVKQAVTLDTSYLANPS